uniref:Uncharacterized protein n=1 Tax=Anguilla anguilla TaxID=7936 RepID=A0A0E9VNN0_ANGAN
MILKNREGYNLDFLLPSLLTLCRLT